MDEEVKLQTDEQHFEAALGEAHTFEGIIAQHLGIAPEILRNVQSHLSDDRVMRDASIQALKNENPSLFIDPQLSFITLSHDPQTITPFEGGARLYHRDRLYETIITTNGFRIRMPGTEILINYHQGKVSGYSVLCSEGISMLPAPYLTVDRMLEDHLFRTPIRLSRGDRDGKNAAGSELLGTEVYYGLSGRIHSVTTHLRSSSGQYFFVFEPETGSIPVRARKDFKDIGDFEIAPHIDFGSEEVTISRPGISEHIYPMKGNYQKWGQTASTLLKQQLPITIDENSI